uniref:Putative terminase n=1 Tax=viral metagenome TaxID=1070528 RepID=A0A6M3JWB2_9ZZZZ
MGNDVAYGGNDKSVFIIRKGSKIVHIGEIDVRDTTYVSGKANSLALELGVQNIKVDVIGIGAGVHDQLNNMKAGRYEVTPINVAEKAFDSEKFLNRRAEYYDGLRQRFFDHDISIPADEELEEELATIKYRFNSRGQMRIEEKDEMKKRLGRSPDKADALMLAFATQKDTAWELPYQTEERIIPGSREDLSGFAMQRKERWPWDS